MTRCGYLGSLHLLRKLLYPKRSYRQLSNFAGVNGMDLREVVGKLEKFGPTSLAEKWDNVGLLVEPSQPHFVEKLMITNDLTEPVLAEAIAQNVDMILSYHPPIFAPLKRLTTSSIKEKIIVNAIENRIAIYSPHTVYDSLEGGVTDWLASSLGECTTKPIIPFLDECTDSAYKLETYLSDHEQRIWSELLNRPNVLELIQRKYVSIISPEHPIKCEIICSKSAMPQILNLYHENFDDKNVQITKLSAKPVLATGSGRLCHLAEPMSLQILVDQVKRYLNMPSLRLATDSYKPLSILEDSERQELIAKKMIQTVAVVAGSGGSLLKGVRADLYLTGEMSHHDVLAAVANGTSVLLCDHSNTERGYLFNRLKCDLTSLLSSTVEIITSKFDGDPLTVI